MRKLIISFLILHTFSLFGTEFLLKLQMNTAKIGDYIVLEQGKTNTFMRIADLSSQWIVMEEISIPRILRKKTDHLSWKEWLTLGAVKRSNWIFYQIHRESGKITQSYSLTKNMQYNLTKESSPLTTLLNLPMQLIPLKERKRLGPKKKGKTAPIWNPPLFVEGRRIPKAAMEAWFVQWPQDGSELSGKRVEVYLPKDKVDLFPYYFPYWLQVGSGIVKSKLRVIDSGKNSTSPHNYSFTNND